MKNKTGVFGWICVGLTVASAVGVAFAPDYSLWFLLLLVHSMVLSVVACMLEQPCLTVRRVLVGGLFIFSSFTKGVDPLGTKYKMLDYFAAYDIQFLNEYAMVLAVLMILAEFLIGICLLTNICPKIATIGATLFMLLFTAVTFFDAVYNKVPDCGCFGTAVKMTNWQTFYKNLVIDATLLPLILNFSSMKSRLKPGVQFLIGMAYALLFTGFEIYNYRHLPVIDFMNWKVGRQMNEKTGKEPQIYVTYRNKTTGREEEFLSPNYPWNDTAWMNQREFVGQRTEGGEVYIGFSALDQDDDDVTEMILNTPKLLMFTSHDMSKITAKEWEKMGNITETARSKGFEVIWVVAETPEEAEAYRELHPFMEEVYFGDELEIKTVVRFNPGLIWLDKGLVKDKWSAVDFPQGEKLDRLLSR